MFTPAVQRIVWKEFRAQRAVWIAIAVELVLLQFCWAIFQNRFPINVFSIAFVLTGVFAMTSSAMLFAAESEAHTDGFLRQLPFRSEDLLIGKLGFCVTAVVAFLGLAMLTTLMAGVSAGNFGGASGDYLGNPALYANGIIGLWAWGMFYSLVTRKVVWTVTGAAATELAVNGVIHGVLYDHRLSDAVVYSTYWVVTLTVILVDAWLLSKWYAGDAGTRPARRLAGSAHLPFPPPTFLPLPWVPSYKIGSWIGVVSGPAFMCLALTFSNLPSPVEGSVIDFMAIQGLIAGTLIALCAIILWPRMVFESNTPPSTLLETISSLNFIDSPLTPRRVLALFGMLGLALVGLILGLVMSYFALAIPLSLTFLPGTNPAMASEISTFFLMSVGSGLALWFGGQGVRSLAGIETNSWLRLLQLSQTASRRIGKSAGSLLWIEARRAVPVLIVGWVLLGLVATYASWREPHARGPLSFFVLGIAGLVCGLQTILPDRSQGSLAFLHDRGVPARAVLGSKIVVWGLTLGLLATIALVIQGDLWKLVVRDTTTYRSIVGPDGVVRLEPDTAQGSVLFVFGIVLGTFVMGVLCAAWLRRPILAIIVGVAAAISWTGWIGSLPDYNALSEGTVIWPIALLLIGIFWTGTATLREQANWKSRLGRVVWVLLVMGVAFQSRAHFRANEIPVVEPDLSHNNIQPAPAAGQLVSSWSSSMSIESLDQLSEDGPQLSALIQPAGFWGSENAFKSAIEQLQLDEDTCDLDASIEHLLKCLKVIGKLTEGSRNEEGWVETLKTRRVVLSAIRRWANHPSQTAERLEKAVLSFGDFNRFDQYSAANALAREYAAAQRAINTGVAMGDENRPTVRLSYFPSLYMSLSGEKERVRRLVDYYFYLSCGTHASQDPSVGQEYNHWFQSTYASAYAMGVSLPPLTLANRHRGQMEMAMSAKRATSFTLRLQVWRLKHGQFPASLVSILQDGEPATDPLTQADYGYQPQGFDLNLRAALNRALPAAQPVLYSLGVSRPHGVKSQGSSDHRLRYYQAMNWASEQSIAGAEYASSFQNHTHRDIETRILAESEGPANPNQIRFVIFGQPRDEDQLHQQSKTLTPQSIQAMEEAIRREIKAKVEAEDQLRDERLEQDRPTAAPVEPDVPPISTDTALSADRRSPPALPGVGFGEPAASAWPLTDWGSAASAVKADRNNPRVFARLGRCRSIRCHRQHRLQLCLIPSHHELVLRRHFEQHVQVLRQRDRFLQPLPIRIRDRLARAVHPLDQSHDRSDLLIGNHPLSCDVPTAPQSFHSQRTAEPQHQTGEGFGRDASLA